MFWYIAVVGVAALSVYCYLISRRLDASRFARDRPFPADEALLADASAWREIDVLNNVDTSPCSIAEAMGRRYLITGASGNLGAFVVDLLQRRGERHIYCMDITPLPNTLANLEGVHFIRCDITDSQAVHAVFAQIKPDVVFHLCAAIRFWERTSFTYRLSAAVNIGGTKNVLKALKSLPDGSSDKTLVFCSSAAVQLYEPLFMRLGWNYRSGYPASWTLTDDREIPDEHLASHCYTVSKAAADRLVREANGVQGVTTGVLRPGMSVCGPNDLLAGMIMRQTTNPTVLDSYAQHLINCQDLAAAFLLYERAILERPHEVAGQHFLVTGDRNNYTWQELRHMIQLFASKDLKYTPIHPFALYALSHVLEAICWIRYYCLLPIYIIIYGTTPSPHPKWMEWGRLYQLQPAIWNTACVDVEIDDSRARKVLGYRNRFSTPQTLRWIVETIESSQIPASELAQQAASKASGEVVAPLNGVTSMLKKEQ